MNVTHPNQYPKLMFLPAIVLIVTHQTKLYKLTVGGENKENKLPNMLMVACLDKPAKCESFINFCRILAKNVKYWPGQAKPWANCSNQMINYFLLICVETKILMFATINILTNYIFAISLIHFFLGEKKLTWKGT